GKPTQRVDKWAPRDGQHDDPRDADKHHVGIHQKPAGHGFFSQHIIEAHWRVPVGLGTEFGDPGNRKDYQQPAEDKPADIDQQAQGISPVGFARIGGGFIAPPRSTGAFVVLRPLRVLARPSCRVRTHRPPLRSCWGWAVYKSWYIPPASNSCSWDPCSTTLP